TPRYSRIRSSGSMSDCSFGADCSCAHRWCSRSSRSSANRRAPMTIYEGYEPLGVLKPVAPEVWIVDGPEIRFKLGILRVPFPTRMTVVRLPSGGLWLHSPVAFDASLAAALRELGPVAHIVAPNTIHYWWVGDWSSRFPAAEVWSVPRLDPGATARVPAHSVLGGRSPPAWEEMFD